MKILILGGTRFLGRFLAEAALANGHEVTLFNRGKSDPELFPEAEKLIGDRDGNLESLKGRSWDAVIDTSGYLPWIVRESLDLLADAAGHYTFISSVSVYDELEEPGVDEYHSVGRLSADRIEELKTMEAMEAIQQHYGELKYLCEQEVERIFAGRSLNIRPGLIVGPHDVTDRFSYWVNRIAKGGQVLAPGRRDKEVQFIDVRDLADWIIRLVGSGETGTFNATGPETELTMEEVLNTCRETVGNRAELVWIEEKFLLGHEVQGWSDMPLWIPDSMNMKGFHTVDIRKALAAGLTFRPLSDTIRDTLAWEETRDVPEKKAGLNPEKEKEVLMDWNEKGL
ncbi:NAD-dependent epimerase/dehydratase family protein [Planococcus sp. CAU13]|uniref:NAD-dependent epimerase/dehydratase family protein n=1 Tax=Planococcus sp. CAU13 TaxID=1541197 RepID=UPI0005300904|nr:NAD-dependent epimerase/dehydratase family protein [Planococcus sp. CAU13]